MSKYVNEYFMDPRFQGNDVSTGTQVTIYADGKGNIFEDLEFWRELFFRDFVFYKHFTNVEPEM